MDVDPLRAHSRERALDPRALHKPGDRRCQRLRAQRTAEYLAGRFSVKEAAAKVFGVGCLGPVKWPDIEALLASPSGAPAVTLHQLAQTRAEGWGLRAVNMSISHQSTVVVTFAVGADDCTCAMAR
ncbi:holo-ACP synthase [Streptomyces luteogriseus]|uniref:holo-ACP synthase n=1 Tax=Streptomyces luteogriseus TaxID=68233 RepID=UPI0037A57718